MKFAFFILFIFISSSLFANDFLEGNKAFQKGNYAEAAKLYEKVVDEGTVSDALYNNLGTAYGHIDSLGLSRLYLEKAYKLNPSKDLEHNISVVVNRLEDSFIEVRPFFLISFYNKLAHLFHANIWFVLSIITALFALGYYFFKSRDDLEGVWRGYFKYIISACLIMSLLFYGLSRRSVAVMQDHKSAVITLPSVSIKKGADQNAAELTELHDGTKVIILDNIGDWLKVTLPNGETGWVLNTQVQKI